MPLDHLRQLPAEVHRVLHADVEALPAHRRMDVRGVAGQQHAPVAVGRGLAGHVGEAGDPRGTVDSEVGAVDADQRVAERRAGWARRRVHDLALGQHDPRSRAVLRLADGVDADGILVEAPRRLVGQSRPRRSASSSSGPIRGTRCRRPCERRSARRRTRPGTRARSDVPSESATSTPLSSCAKPVTSRPRWIVHAELVDPARPGCARCGSATARARSGAASGSR